jgi:hypothetical protein
MIPDVLPALIHVPMSVRTFGPGWRLQDEALLWKLGRLDSGSAISAAFAQGN